jgi:D-alanyl-D-alanine carboxypeptidase
MDGLAAIGSRIAEINAQLTRLSPPATLRVSSPGSGAVSGSSAATAGGSAGAGTPATAPTAATSFADVLAGAVQAGAVQAGAATNGTTTGAATTVGTTTTAPATAGSTTSRGSNGVSTGSTTVSPVGAPSGTARPSSTGKVTAAGVPVELARYGNGHVPATALESIGGGHRLWAPAAEAFGRLKAAAHRAGVSIGVTDSYRSYAQQVDVARRKGLHSQGGLAAKPGTSEHGWGKSLDLRLDASALRWMRGHASDYGFSENVSRESWHWTYAAR